MNRAEEQNGRSDRDSHGRLRTGDDGVQPCAEAHRRSTRGRVRRPRRRQIRLEHMDLGYRAEDILWLVEHGLLTLGYQSSSYLTDRVPELGFVDLPFLFARTQGARAAVDGALGQLLARKIEER